MLSLYFGINGIHHVLVLEIAKHIIFTCLEHIFNRFIEEIVMKS